MATPDAPKVTPAHYDDQLVALRDAAATTIDSCIVAKFIAAADARVRDLFFKKIASGYLFEGVSCINRIGIPENRYVLFEFDCIPGTFCLVPPSFLVVVNIIDRHVVAITDPYLPTSYTSQAPSSGCGCAGGSAPVSSTSILRDDCANLEIKDGKICLSIDYAGDVCVSVPNSIPNGTIAEACVHICKKFGIPKGARVEVKVAGIRVACQSWGDCDC